MTFVVVSMLIAVYCYLSSVVCFVSRLCVGCGFFFLLIDQVSILIQLFFFNQAVDVATDEMQFSR